MPKFGNSRPRLGGMVPNNFKHFVHINLFLFIRMVEMLLRKQQRRKIQRQKGGDHKF